MADRDALDRLLDLARSEGALSPDQIVHFAQGLRERARLVLEERSGSLERKIEACEASATALHRENSWLRDGMAAVESRAAWLKTEAENWRAARDQAAAALQQAQAAHDRLLAHHQQAMATLERAQAAHDRLLAHHREVVSRAARNLRVAASLRFWKVRECRAQLSDVAALLEGEGV